MGDYKDFDHIPDPADRCFYSFSPHIESIEGRDVYSPTDNWQNLLGIQQPALQGSRWFQENRATHTWASKHPEVAELNDTDKTIWGNIGKKKKRFLQRNMLIYKETENSSKALNVLELYPNFFKK